MARIHIFPNKNVNVREENQKNLPAYFRQAHAATADTIAMTAAIAMTLEDPAARSFIDAERA